jgi:hypothetical protein
MPKRNRDNLMAQSLYDLLSDINASFMSGKPHCVLEAITGEPMICKHESCNHCIADWLNDFQF